jgi:hypothetical protein
MPRRDRWDFAKVQKKSNTLEIKHIGSHFGQNMPNLAKDYSFEFVMMLTLFTMAL